MSLTRKENNLMKLLGVICVLSAGILYMVFQPQEFETIQGEKKEKKEKVEVSGGSGSRGGGGGSGGSRGSSSSSSARESTGGTVSLSDFESHKSVDNCWVLIDAEVYDITAYIDTIEDVDNISGYCGTFVFEEGYIEGDKELKEAIIDLSSLMGSIS